MPNFSYLHLLEIRLEIIPDTFVEEKKTFFKIINQNFSTPKNPIFPKGLTYGLGKKKIQFFSFSFIGQNKTRNSI